MTDGKSDQITQLLADWSSGDEGALERLIPLCVYDELSRMTRGYMRRQPSDHTFQTTELIHEAYRKLANNGGRDFKNRAPFCAVAAKAMRHILVDYARSKQCDKRGGGRDRISLADDIAISVNRTDQLVALDEALKNLESLDERKCRVVELPYFGGCRTKRLPRC